MQSLCWIPKATSAHGMLEPNALKDTNHGKSWASTFLLSIPRKTYEPASHGESWRLRSATVDLKMKAGACARTDRNSGQTLSSPPSETAPDDCSVSAKLLVTLPIGCR